MPISVFPLEDENNVVHEDLVFNLINKLFLGEGALQASDLNVSVDTDGIGVKVAPGGAIVLYDSAFGGKRVFFNSIESKSGPNEFPNKSFDVNTSLWQAIDAVTLTRDTGIFHSSPASGKIATSGASSFSQGIKISDRILRVNSSELQEVSCWMKADVGVSVKLKIDELGVQALTNPSFEIDTSTWSSSGVCTIARDTSEFYNGIASCKVDTSGTAQWEGIFNSSSVPAAVAGEIWSGSVWAKGSGTVYAIIHALDSGDNIIGDYYSFNTVLSSTWKQLTVTTTALPVNTAKLRILVSGSSIQDVIFYVDDFSMNKLYVSKEAIVVGTGDWTKLAIPQWTTNASCKYVNAQVLISAGGSTNVYVDDFALTRNFDWFRSLEIADSANPRVDRLVVQVRDKLISGGGDTVSDGKLRVIAGTPTSGATLVNLTGAAAVPSNCFLIANVLVPVNATSLSAANIDNAVRITAALNVPVSLLAGFFYEYGGTSAPNASYLLCDGSAVSRTTYALLFGVIGTGYGVGDGSTTFNLPDFRGRIAVGKGTNTDVDNLGDSDGDATVGNRRPKHKHTLSIASDGSHDHGGTGGVGDHSHSYGKPGGGGFLGGGTFFGEEGATTGSAGGHSHSISSGGSHNHSGTTVGPTTNVITDGPAWLTVNKLVTTGL